MRASGRSTLLMTRITGSRASSALRSTKRVCGSGPSLASTSSSTPSTIVMPRSTSPPKSAWPGVSTMFSLTPRWWTDVFLARIVMPFSRSRSIESSTRVLTSWPTRKAPDCHSIASTSVVLPWSTCATIATLRMSSLLTSIRPRLAAHPRGPGARQRAQAKSRQRRRVAFGGGDRLLERRREAPDLLLLDHERGQHLDRVHAVARNLAEDPVLVEQRHGDELGEEAGLTPLDRLPQRPPGAAPGSAQLDRPHQPEAAHVAHHPVALDQRRRQLEQQRTHARGVGDQVLPVEHPQRGERGRGREVGGAECRAVAHGPLHPVEHPLERSARYEHGADWHKPARERLGEADHVGLEL